MKYADTQSELRIAVFVRNPNAGGGIQTFAKELAEFSPNDIEMTFISSKPVSSISSDRIFKSNSLFKRFKLSLNDFDLILIHQFSLKFYLFARISRKPIVIVTHIWDLQARDVRSIFFRWLKKFLMNQKGLNLIFVSESVKQKLGLNGEVIPNRSTYLLNDTAMVKKDRDLIFVGRFLKEKGVFVFIDILSKLNIICDRKITATIVGEGPEFQNIQKTLIDYGLEEVVEVLPWISRDRLKFNYLRHRILVVPSLWDEPYGLVAAEGLSLGLKVFCSNRKGLIEATLGKAIYFDPYSINGVVTNIIEELTNESTTMDNSKIILDLSFTKTIEQYQDLFYKCMRQDDI